MVSLIITTFPNHSQIIPKSFPVQIVDNLPYCFIRVFLHDAHVVEDWAVVGLFFDESRERPATRVPARDGGFRMRQGVVMA